MKSDGRETHTRFQVGLMGASLHTPNRGVSALGASLASLIWRSRPEATISLLIGNRDARPADVIVNGGVRTIETVNYRLWPRDALGKQLWWIILMSCLYRVAPLAAVRRWITGTSNWIKTVVESDFVGDIRGGDSFSDIYGAKHFMLGCFPVLSVIWIRGGIHLLPQTYGPFRSRLAERLARYILLRAHSILCRDRISLQEVSRLTCGRRRGTLCPDVAFAMGAIRPESLAVDIPLCGRDGKTLIGLNISGLVYYGGYTRANIFGLKLDYRMFVKSLVQQLLSDQSNQILMVPHNLGAKGRVESDPAACLELKQALPASLRDRVHLVTGAYDQHEIKGIIGMCDFFIGSRMHACIAALSQGIPTVGVAYSRKFAGVFEMVGAADWVVDGRTQSAHEALRRIDELFCQRDDRRALLRAKVTAAQEELFRTFDHLVGARPFSKGNDDSDSRSSERVAS